MLRLVLVEAFMHLWWYGVINFKHPLSHICRLGQAALVTFEGCLVGPQDPFGLLCFLEWSCLWSLAGKFLHLNIFNPQYVYLLYLSDPPSKTWKEKPTIRGPLTLWAAEQSKDHSNSSTWPYFIFFIFRIFSSSAITLFPPTSNILSWLSVRGRSTDWIKRSNPCLKTRVSVDVATTTVRQQGLVWFGLVQFGEPNCWFNGYSLLVHQ